VVFGSRGKGSAAEIEIAKLIETWWRQLEPNCRVCRTPLSGGWGGKDLRAGFRASGDLMTTAKRFPFTVEVKRRENWTWKTLLAGKPSPVWGWWQQAIGQAAEVTDVQLEPLLVWRKNREPWHVMVHADSAFARCFRKGAGRWVTKIGAPESWVVIFPIERLLSLKPERIAL